MPPSVNLTRWFGKQRKRIVDLATRTRKTAEATNERTLLDREKVKALPTTIDKARGAARVAVQEIMIEDGSNTTTTTTLVTIIMETQEAPTMTIPARDGEGVPHEAITRLIQSTTAMAQPIATTVIDIHHSMIDITTTIAWLVATAIE